jgi:carbonic anhydrase
MTTSIPAVWNGVKRTDAKIVTLEGYPEDQERMGSNMRWKLGGTLMTVAALMLTPVAGAAESGERRVKASPDEAMEKLEAGNARFVSASTTHPRIGTDRRQQTSDHGQYPFATILSCSDSRAPVEYIFDQGIGDLFVIRVAGNVADTDEIGTIEYGVEHLHTPLLVVLGHTQCGAVSAVVKGADVDGNIPKLVDNIVPAVKKAKDKYSDLSGDEFIMKAIKANVWQGIEDLFKHSEDVRTATEHGHLKVVGGVYHLDTGQVEWLGEHPHQKKLMSQAEDSATVGTVAKAGPCCPGHDRASEKATSATMASASSDEADRHESSSMLGIFALGGGLLIVLGVGAGLIWSRRVHA